jgi:pheromone shutdown protein TraB
LFGFAWALAYFIMIVDEVMGDRDKKMAEEILRISEEEGYESVLVSCGGNHRSGIASYLEDEGWETKEKTTDSPIGKVLLWIERLFGAVMNPATTVRKGYSKLRTLI